MKKSCIGIKFSSVDMIKAGLCFAVGKFGWEFVCAEISNLVDKRYIRLAKAGNPYGIRYCKQFDLDYEES